MNVGEAINKLGVRNDTLTAEESAGLDQDGFLHIASVLRAEQLEGIRRRMAGLLSEEGDRAGTEVHQEAGTDRLSNLINKGREFEVLFQAPKVLAAIAQVLHGDLKLSSLNIRSALPGSGLQDLHADWGRLETPGDYQVCNSIWLLDDFTADNGATRAVRGTHLGTKTPGDEMANPSLTHPREELLLGKAGDVFVFNSHNWHGGTLNRTTKPRRAMHGYFCRRHQPQQLEQRRHLGAETIARLSEPVRVLLDV